MLSDGKSRVELVAGGEDKELTFENRLEYARKKLYVRMNEFKRQAHAIKKGMCQIVPEALLNMVSHAELEEWVYGKKHIDVDLLRRNTGYEGAYKEPGNKVVEWFWRALREMSQDERRQFILFCYAQPTIPANDEEFRRQKKRFLIAPQKSAGGDEDDHGDADQRLMKASTCFFNLWIPQYTSYEILKAKITQAIILDNVTLNAEENDLNDM